MKQGADWGESSNLNVRDEEPQGPIEVGPLTPQDRHRQFGWRVPVGLFVAIALLALAGHALDLYETSTRVVPPAPTPIAWVNAIVSPSGAGSNSIPSVAAEAITHSVFWTAGEPNHFTVQLTNTTSAAIPLTPCPTYSMYVLGTPANLATVRAMNCADMGSIFQPGETLTLDMVYTPTATDPLGFESLVWRSSSGFLATAQVASIEIQE